MVSYLKEELSLLNDKTLLIANTHMPNELNGNGVVITNTIDNKLIESLNTEVELLRKKIASQDKTANDVSLTNSMEVNKIIEDNKLIDSLNSEVEFLRKEVASKDKIIELLITESRGYNNVNEFKNNEPLFIHPKKSAKLNHNPEDNNYNIKIQNRFGMLDTTPLTENDNCNFNECSGDINASVNSANNKRKNYRSTTIIGDSIVKDVNAIKMRRCLPKGDKVYVKSFPGATTECMVDYVKPSLKYNPDLIIIHTGVNNLRTKKSPEVIADEIIKLACSIKTTSNEVVISTLVERGDGLKFKGQQVNEFLISKCVARNIYYINNSNINARQHLNSTSHLNYNGTTQLACNFLKCINV